MINTFLPIERHFPQKTNKPPPSHDLLWDLFSFFFDLENQPAHKHNFCDQDYGCRTGGYGKAKRGLTGSLTYLVNIDLATISRAQQCKHLGLCIIFTESVKPSLQDSSALSLRPWRGFFESVKYSHDPNDRRFEYKSVVRLAVQRLLHKCTSHRVWDRGTDLTKVSHLSWCAEGTRKKDQESGQQDFTNKAVPDSDLWELIKRLAIIIGGWMLSAEILTALQARQVCE